MAPSSSSSHAAHSSSSSAPPSPPSAQPNAAQKPLPLHFNLAAGAIAGVSEILVMYPLDVVKTRFQIQVGATQQSIFGAISSIIKNEGPATLYRGILPPILVEAPKRAIKFGANSYYSEVYKKFFGVEKLDQKLSVLTGVSAGLTEALVVVSFEMVKIRLQDKANQGKYKNTMDAVTKIYQQEGPLAFFKGLEATLWRHGLWNGVYFGIIHAVKNALPVPKDKSQEVGRNFVAGAIAGSLATAVNTPPDVVKTRIQNQTTLPYKYNWTLPSLATIAREEGVRALYKGFVPKVLRLGPGGGILLVVFEQVSEFMRRKFL